jgi:prevent-host-death family protein
MNPAILDRSRDAPIRRVAIRELQQHAARVIKELTDADEVAEITSRGEVVARLVPVSPAERAFAQMIERGEIIPAKRPGGLAGWQPLPGKPGKPDAQNVPNVQNVPDKLDKLDGGSLADHLITMREEERQ